MNETRFIVAKSFIDGSGTDVRSNVFLAVKDTIITAIGSIADLPSNDGAVIDDFSHCTILPALVDCSVSLLRSPSVDTKVQLSTEESDIATKAATLKRHISYCHEHGVLGVANNGDLTDLVEYYQEGVALNSLIDVRSSGLLCRSMQDWTAGNSADRDFLKIDYSGNIDDEESSQPRLDHEGLCRILQQKNGKKAVVVTNGRQQVEEAIEAGCDAIEQGYAMGEDNLKKMAEKDILWIPSVILAKNGLDGAGSDVSMYSQFSTHFGAPGKQLPRAKDFWKKVLAEQLTQLSLARELGVKTAVGTGAGSVGILHGESMIEEIRLFKKAGYSLEESIRCASEIGARFFGMEKLGALTVGRKATFLLSKGTVLHLPRKLSYLEGIYVDGIPSAAYRKNPLKAV